MSTLKYLLGIDLGTSSVKAVVIDEKGKLISTGFREYAIDSPQNGWAEQNPRDWWDATALAVREAVHTANVMISAIGLCGQMHGTVLIGANHEPIYPAIIWADQRSVEEVEEMIALVGKDTLSRTAGTAPATGFTGSTLLWLKRYDPSMIEKARVCILPKDYIRLRLTGNLATDPSDASSTALFDIRKRRWSAEIIEKVGLPHSIFPDVMESSQVAGKLITSTAEQLGLSAGIPVVTGCADQVAQAVRNGLFEPGLGSVTIGSGGQVFVPLDKAIDNIELSLHVFCHAPRNRWYILGAMLAAGLSLRWFRDLLNLTNVSDAYRYLSMQAAEVSPGSDGLLFLPYLAGERSPLMDPHARGCFIGLTLRHERAHLARAIMEGVAFALRHILDEIASNHVSVDVILAAGNGLRSPVWRQILSDILNKPIISSKHHEQTGSGAALISAIGVGIYDGYDDLKTLTHQSPEVTEPIQSHVTFYERRYMQFLSLYPILKQIIHDLGKY